jgi:hypothetical protein
MALTYSFFRSDCTKAANTIATNLLISISATDTDVAAVDDGIGSKLLLAMRRRLGAAKDRVERRSVSSKYVISNLYRRFKAVKE